MINLKKIGVGFGISAIATMMLTSPVIAKSNDGISTSYSKVQHSEFKLTVTVKHPNTTFVDQDNNLTDDEEIEALKECSISNFEYDDDSSIFCDGSVQEDVDYASRHEYEIIDLGLMADKMNKGLVISRGDAIFPKDEVFNNGVMIIRSYEDSTFAHYICKCNESEFNDFYNFYVDKDWDNLGYDEDTGNEIYTLNIKGDNGKIEGRSAITYNRNNEILNYTYMYY